MPLLDHFHPPLHPQHHWESFHSNWATRIADALNDQWLPPEFIAEESTHAGARVEIDVATFESASGDGSDAAPAATAATTVVSAPAWAPPQAAHTMPTTFPDQFEVHVFSTINGMQLVGAIELISPGNKDRREQRRAFAAKCASYLHQGISLIVIDIVTNRRANLHNETMRLMEAEAEYELTTETDLYAVAYRPVLRDDQPQIDLWSATLEVGQPLPELPLRLKDDLFVPVDFESTYQEACRRRRLT